MGQIFTTDRYGKHNQERERESDNKSCAAIIKSILSERTIEGSLGLFDAKHANDDRSDQLEVFAGPLDRIVGTYQPRSRLANG
jgi:predicted kinase